MSAQGERREEREVEAQEGHEGAEEVTTQEKCVGAKKETNSVHVNDVSNRRMGVDESGEQPEKQRNRLATMKGSKRARVLPKRQRERSGEEKKEEKDRTNSAVKTLCTSCYT